MKIFYKAMLIVVAFLVFVCLLYLGFDKWILKPSSKFDLKAWEAENERQERAIKLVKDRFWVQLKPVIESKRGYVKHIGWEAFKISGRSDYYEREISYPLQESTYIVSYTYTTPELMKEDKVFGWWWEVVLGENTVRSINYDQYWKEKSLADSIRASKKPKEDYSQYSLGKKPPKSVKVSYYIDWGVTSVVIAVFVCANTFVWIIIQKKRKHASLLP